MLPAYFHVRQRTLLQACIVLNICQDRQTDRQTEKKPKEKKERKKKKESQKKAEKKERAKKRDDGNTKREDG